MGRLDHIVFGALIEQFRRDYFRPTVISVHLRRGDFLRVHPRSAANAAEAIRQIEAQIAADPKGGIRHGDR